MYSAAKAGDTIESMAYDRDQLEGFAAEFKNDARGVYDEIMQWQKP